MRNLLLTGQVLPQEAEWSYGYGSLSRANTQVMRSSTFIDDGSDSDCRYIMLVAEITGPFCSQNTFKTF